MKLPPCKTFLHYPHAKHRAEAIITITDPLKEREPTDEFSSKHKRKDIRVRVVFRL